MPQPEMEPGRGEAPVQATVPETGQAGALNVLVWGILRGAGMLYASAHHCYGGNNRMPLAAMRLILSGFGGKTRRRLTKAIPRRYAEAIAHVCFVSGIISAWMAFRVPTLAHLETLRLAGLASREYAPTWSMHCVRCQKRRGEPPPP